MIILFELRGSKKICKFHLIFIYWFPDFHFDTRFYYDHLCTSTSSKSRTTSSTCCRPCTKTRTSFFIVQSPCRCQLQRILYRTNSSIGSREKCPSCCSSDGSSNAYGLYLTGTGCSCCRLVNIFVFDIQ